MNRDAQRVLQRVVTAWDNAIHGLKQMSQASIVKPTTSYEIFKLDADTPDDVIKFNVGPVVFLVPERPNRRGPDLYIVVKGWLSFQGPDFRTEPLKTKDFGTEVAYFRSKQGALEHVYGAHYDMDEVRPGHPVFHAQFASQLAFGERIHHEFRVDDNLVDSIAPTLGTVRVPSAQMDIFSVITQICADHLLGQGAGPDVQAAFSKMRSACDFFIGAAHRLTFLNGLPATTCYRSTHWYESPLATP